MTETNTVKTAELTGEQLDWAVAVACGYALINKSDVYCGEWERPNDSSIFVPWFNPSTDWSKGGPIIEREHGHIETGDRHQSRYFWIADMGRGNDRYRSYGPTPLIASMRAFVGSRLGDEVEVPTADPEPDKICPDWNGNSCKHGCKKNCGCPF